MSTKLGDLGLSQELIKRCVDQYICDIETHLSIEQYFKDIDSGKRLPWWASTAEWTLFLARKHVGY